MGQSTTILVVEDEAIVRENVCLDLEDAGFTVIEASNAEEALRFLLAPSGSDPVGLLVTDIQMPGLDGWALAEQARGLNPGLDVVYASSNPVLPARAVPRSRFLRKPFSTAHLVDTVRQLRAS